jgi:nucleotide-binding universal stress UspA family protein
VSVRRAIPAVRGLLLASVLDEHVSLDGRIALEEAADVIVVGSRSRGRLQRGFESRLADALDVAPAPVLIARHAPGTARTAENGGWR